MDTSALTGLLLIGMVPGFYLGRWYAETFRAKVEMKRAWAGRGGYRRRDR